ncbi:hypothetical protein QBC34DRAFT_474141 [Podospora aff. communis PSN243]|uniref:Indoleamine 2,3-dioxygenase n=1 Tax=Podospora aff. communis PSN243 TaxID=3040156 RepID=A0AAV9G9B4_9PEZI|nr:hypothetical protein QBC34DRAFT_474141 [Podospora aff. communis PSN243]
MSFTTEYLILSILATVFFAFKALTTWRPSISNLPPVKSRLDSMISLLSVPNKTSHDPIQEINNLADCHETAACLAELIHKDGAGEWPPRSNYDYPSWPAPLHPYLDIYHEMKALLPAAKPSLDDDENRSRIDSFRSRHAKLLESRVDLPAVTQLLQAADAGRWDVFPRDVYNGFYCCIAWHRHAYRWGTIPSVRPAQLELSLPLPHPLTTPWTHLQSHFGLISDSGNIMSNIVLNFSPSGHYQFRINSGLSPSITSSEEEFSRVLRGVEGGAIPIYAAIIKAILAYNRGEMESCLVHTRQISEGLRPVLAEYYDRVHDKTIARSAWLSRVQGFYAWGMGFQDERTGEWVKYDGLSGNQVMLFQAVDAFLGLEVYLGEEARLGNVPRLQREFCEAVGRASFRAGLGEGGGVEGMVRGEMGEIVKRLRVFRSAHRSRAKEYLLVPAPERLPMTAGKSLLKADMETSLEFLDAFMVGRLQQTV